MAGARCEEDELLIRAIRESSRYSGDANNLLGGSIPKTPLKYSRARKILFIYDARPLGNAMYNQVAGHGYETPQNYTLCKVSFLNIENIHLVRKRYVVGLACERVTR
jgi:hypothetical protein